MCLFKKYGEHLFWDGPDSKTLNIIFVFLQVKPAVAGSSIGVTVAYGVADSLKKANDLILEVIHFQTAAVLLVNHRRVGISDLKLWLEDSTNIILCSSMSERGLTIKSLLKYSLREEVSLQPLYLMWDLALIVILLFYCQLR